MTACELRSSIFATQRGMAALTWDPFRCLHRTSTPKLNDRIHMPNLSAPYLRSVATAILQATGTPAEQAQLVSDSLVAANLLGHDSHGVLRLKSYVDLVHSGQIMPAALPTVSERHGAVVHIDGGWGWGQLAARLATDTTIAVAREHGLGAATIGRCNHIGRLGEYVEMIARAGMIGLALCNAGAVVAPYGGR